MDEVKVFCARVRAGDEKAAKRVAAEIKRAGSWRGGAEALGVAERTLWKWRLEVPEVEKATRDLLGIGRAWRAGT